MATGFVRKFIKWFFILGNILISLLFLVACLSPFLNPHDWPIIGFLPLAVPYLATALIFYLIFWLIVKPVRVLIPLVTLLIGWKQLSVIFAWHPSRTFNINYRTDSTLRIITWNVRGMYGMSNSGYVQIRSRNEIAALINKYNADVVCLQEFMNNTNSKYPFSNNIGLFTGECPYYFFARDGQNPTHTSSWGTILFSKYPILDSGKIKFPGAASESLIYVDILKGNDTIRIFTTHLQSFQFNADDYKDLEKIKKQDDEALKASENIYSKMKLAYSLRGLQATIVRTATDKSPYPSVVCGDFNDVPNSYTYFQIRGKRQDAFLASSFGVGRSFDALAPTLRIDYILPDDHFNIHQFEMVDQGLSDHHLLVTDLSLKK